MFREFVELKKRHAAGAGQCFEDIIQQANIQLSQNCWHEDPNRATTDKDKYHTMLQM